MSLRRWLPIAAALVLTAAACGGGSDATSDEVIQKAFQATDQPGTVLHLKGDDDSEIWADVQKQDFRSLGSLSSGRQFSIGNGWSRSTYDPSINQVTTQDLTPAAGASAQPRIDHPVARWLDAFSALAFAPDVQLLGDAQADGVDVVVLEARSPIVEQEQFAGKYLVGRVELDARTYLPHAFEQRVQLPAADTPQPTVPGQIGGPASQAAQRTVYTTVEMLDRSQLPADFFSVKVLDNQIATVAKSLQKMRDLGLTPYWLGERYEGASVFALPGDDQGVKVDAEGGTAAFHYQLQIPGTEPSVDSVIIELAKADKLADLGQPSFPQFGGALPEQTQPETVRGGTGTLYVSLLSPSDIPCPAASCPASTAPLYFRLTFIAGDTAVQIETFARVDFDGSDANKANNRDGIIALAEALIVAP